MRTFTHSCWTRRSYVSLLASGALALCVPIASAHHGWNWAEDEQMTLVGSVESVSMAPPHPTLKVKTREGVLWQVDLGNPSQTERSGFASGKAKAGDPITVLGNRSKEQGKMHMKAVRITVDGKNFDMYPERIRN